MKGRQLFLIACAMMTCCAPTQATDSSALFAAKVSVVGEVRLVGWARLYGELLIYPDRKSMHGDLKYPHCVSAVFSDQKLRNLREYDGKMVTIIGELFDYEKLPAERGVGSTILPRKELSDSIIPNFCLGDKVILIKSIAHASAASN